MMKKILKLKRNRRKGIKKAELTKASVKMDGRKGGRPRGTEIYCDSLEKCFGRKDCSDILKRG